MKRNKFLLVFLVISILFSNSVYFTGVNATSVDELTRDKMTIKRLKTNPKYTVLVLDSSFSLRRSGVLEVEKLAKRFAKEYLQNPANKLALVSYSDSAKVLTDFTNSLDDFEKAIKKLNTGFYSKMSQAFEKAEKLLDNAKIDFLPQGAKLEKHIVLVSDGIPDRGKRLNTRIKEKQKYNILDTLYYRRANFLEDLANKIKAKGIKISTISFFKNLVFEKKFASKFMQSIQNAGFSVFENAEKVIFDFDFRKNNENQKTPIIIIPGVMGSELYRDNNTEDIVWPPSVEGLGKFAKRLEINRNLYTKNTFHDMRKFKKRAKDSKWESGTRVYGALNAYKEVLDFLIEKFPDRPVYFFSYDFRKPQDYNADKLRYLMEQIFAIDSGTKYSSVDLVAHSMGGLVASAYHKKYGDANIRNVITAGTPFEGAPKLLKAVLHDDLFSSGKYEDYVFSLMYFADKMLALVGLNRDIKSSFPAIAQLSPSQDYVKSVPQKEYISGDLSWKKFKNLSLEKYNGILKLIFGDKNYQKIRDLDKLKHRVNNQDINNLTKFKGSHFILGINQATLSHIAFKNINDRKKLECDNLFYEFKGDGTVPFKSANMIDYLSEFQKTNPQRVLKIDSGHLEMLSNSKALHYIQDIINDGKTNIQSDKDKQKDYVVIRLNASVDINIANQNKMRSRHLAKEDTIVSDIGRIDTLGEKGEIKYICLDSSKVNDLEFLANKDEKIDYSISWFDSNNRLLDKREFKNLEIRKDDIIQSSSKRAFEHELKLTKKDQIGEEVFKLKQNEVLELE